MKRTTGKPHLYRFGNLSAFPGLGHFVTTRIGGVSSPPYASLNLGFQVPDDPRAVLANRLRVAEAVDLPLESFVFCRQHHGAHVTVVGRHDRGRGARELADALGGTDALLTGDPDVCLVVLVADCVPILLFDPVQRAVAAAHAGWRGTVAGVAVHTVRALCARFGSAPADIRAGIGPSIGPHCYEVGPEVIQRAERAGLSWDGLVVSRNRDRAYFNLWEANRRQLIEAGLREKHVEVASICTHCQAEEFFSERAGHRPTGRFAAGIFLRDSDDRTALNRV